MLTALGKMQRALVVLLGLLGLSVASASTVLLFDSQAGSYLLPSSTAVQLQQEQLASLASAVSGLLPPSAISAEQSAQVSGAAAWLTIRRAWHGQSSYSLLACSILGAAHHKASKVV